MTDFLFYFKWGWQHIISWEASDHLLFILALTAIYLLGNWKQVLVLITAFTIGHSITLALSVYQLISLNGKWTEFLIACTIVITAVFNLLQKDYAPRKLRLNYYLALFFGLIHGLGFANSLRFMMGKDDTIALGLFGFNVGVEAGQIAVVGAILFASFVIVNQFKLKRNWWVWSLSLIAVIKGLLFCIARLP
jgi:HupE / UreJ protein